MTNNRRLYCCCCLLAPLLTGCVVQNPELPLWESLTEEGGVLEPAGAGADTPVGGQGAEDLFPIEDLGDEALATENLTDDQLVGSLAEEKAADTARKSDPLDQIRRSAGSFYDSVRQAIRAGKASKAAQYIGRALKFAKIIDTAWTISRAYNDAATGRDRRAEQAFEHGRSIGARDAERFRTNPRQAYIDVNWRAQYYGTYRVVFDAGYAAGWRSVME